jgi:L-ascorbate metabolism protein UlaG (beta-lactamase superfamily)
VLRAALRLTARSAGVLAGGWLLRALRGTYASVGARPGEIKPVATRSSQFDGNAFVNIEPASMGISMDREERRRLFAEMFGSGGASRPPGPIPLVRPVEAEAGEAGVCAVSWYGHSSALIEVDGFRVLTDPIWSDRCSPSRVVGPRRLHAPPAPLESLPALDAVLISHDHYDHLDIDTVMGLARTQRAPFVVPLGIGAHLRKWGIPETRIVELDWNESHRIGDLTLVCTPARHFSGRLFRRNTTLWASWVVIGPGHRAFFGGDTGYTKSFTEIGSEHGPFDLTLLPVGAYNPAWPDIHMNPEESVRAHLDMTESGLLVPIHWATFRLAPHPWAEPVHRLLAAADPAGVQVAVPKPGQRVDRDSPVLDPWWQL